MSTYGTLLKVTSFGESHGKAIGCVIDGFLPNIEINFDLIQKQLNRRRPNQSKLTSNRNEQDKLVVLSGFDENKTLGTPITFLINNEDIKKENYSSFIDIPRPGHGDYTYFKKYNVKNKSGSSRFSGRETATRVAAGACIEQWLHNFYHCTIVCYVHSVGNIRLPEHIIKNFERNPPSRDLVDTYGTVKYDQRRGTFIDFFVKGIEFGSGFDGTYMLGSDHNDLFSTLDASEEGPYQKGCTLTDTIHSKRGEMTPGGSHSEEDTFFEKDDCHRSDHPSNRSHPRVDESTRDTSSPSGEKLLITTSNNCGGILAGITTGNNIVFRSAIKPVSSIQIEKETCNFFGQRCKLKVTGMHDCCILPRLPPIIEASTSIVIGDMILRQVAKYGHSKLPSVGYLSRSKKE
ncbi:chorismate synthase [Plasmodium cynomolgi strain B]|uniref:chorismate synthase n=1 Tax=Plasmodium cynomolgi (strain B) TaxID=1120755 RepID=K6UL18_PLACD|nr:chorismate synthase [Plasmodium cynomolgi strain B]GAB67328.1 chorismate synthase [Plasmodium cynomolgi strain B]